MKEGGKKGEWKEKNQENKMNEYYKNSLFCRAVKFVFVASKTTLWVSRLHGVDVLTEIRNKTLHRHYIIWQRCQITQKKSVLCHCLELEITFNMVAAESTSVLCQYTFMHLLHVHTVQHLPCKSTVSLRVAALSSQVWEVRVCFSPSAIKHS
jgi:hypothetical protein